MTNIIQNEAGCSGSTSLSSQDNGTNNDRMIAAVLSEEFAKLDGAVARRLSSLSSIPVRFKRLLIFFASSNVECSTSVVATCYW